MSKPIRSKSNKKCKIIEILNIINCAFFSAINVIIGQDSKRTSKVGECKKNMKTSSINAKNHYLKKAIRPTL